MSKKVVGREPIGMCNKFDTSEYLIDILERIERLFYIVLQSKIITSAYDNDNIVENFLRYLYYLSDWLDSA